MNNLLKYGIGLAALGLTVYVAGVAWRRSQKNNNKEAAGFSSMHGDDDEFASMSPFLRKRRPKSLLRTPKKFVRTFVPLSRIRPRP